MHSELRIPRPICDRRVIEHAQLDWTIRDCRFELLQFSSGHLDWPCPSQPDFMFPGTGLFWGVHGHPFAGG